MSSSLQGRSGPALGSFLLLLRPGPACFQSAGDAWFQKNWQLVARVRTALVIALGGPRSRLRDCTLHVRLLSSRARAAGQIAVCPPHPPTHHHHHRHARVCCWRVSLLLGAAFRKSALSLPCHLPHLLWKKMCHRNKQLTINPNLRSGGSSAGH
jgi:hypothetical protein